MKMLCISPASRHFIPLCTGIQIFSSGPYSHAPSVQYHHTISKITVFFHILIFMFLDSIREDTFC
jgi:hypothetical protein